MDFNCLWLGVGGESGRSGVQGDYNTLICLHLPGCCASGSIQHLPQPQPQPLNGTCAACIQGRVWYSADAEILLFECFFFSLNASAPRDGGGGGVFKGSTLVHLTSFGWCVESDRKTPSWSLCSVLWLIGRESTDIWRTALATFTEDLWLCSTVWDVCCVLYIQRNRFQHFVPLFVCPKSSLESDPVCTVYSIWSHQIVFEPLPLFSFQCVPPPPFISIVVWILVSLQRSDSVPVVQRSRMLFLRCPFSDTADHCGFLKYLL